VRFVLAVVLALWLVLPAFASGEVPEQQTVTAVEPPGEQRVEPVGPAGEQHVEAVDASGEQQVSSGHKNIAARGAETAGKVVLVVVAGVVSLGVMAAELLFL
jgi:hypothetical protein